MARIIVSYYKIQEVPVGEVLCFWDGFVQDLKAAGNDVFLINTAYFNPYGSNEVKNKRLDQLLLEKAKQFDPQLIITFNHRIPKSFLETFDVPIIAWDGDELSFFCDLPYLKEHIDRYNIFTISKGWIHDYTEFGFRPEQISFVPQATAVRKMDIEQTMNVSFLGIRHFHNKKYFNLVRSHQYSDQFGKIVHEFLNTDTFDYEGLFKKYFSEQYPQLQMSLRDLYPLFDYRWLALSNMLDLGLTISGHQSRWEDTAEFMPQLMAVYNPQRVWTLQENNVFYNASKISMCPITAQARGSAFSWRVFDIMASNACLLISQASDLKELTRDYVELPMYRTPWEARDLAKKLLEDEPYRKQIVADSQRYIDENARWIHRFKDMEQIMGMKIINEGYAGSSYDVILDDKEVQSIIEKTNKSSVFAIEARKQLSPEEQKKETKKRSLYQKVRERVKSFCYTWSAKKKILKIALLSILLVLGGLLAMTVTKVPFVSALGPGICFVGLMGLVAAAGLAAIKLLLKRRNKRNGNN